jgi:outer membrane protein TolC
MIIWEEGIMSGVRQVEFYQKKTHWMRFKAYLSIGLLTLSFCNLALAIEIHSAELSVVDAVLEGLRHSPQIQSAEARFEEKDWGRVGALSGFLPTISVSAQHFFSAKYQYLNTNFGGNPAQFPMVFPNTSLTLSAMLPLFDGFQNWNRYEAQRLQAQVAHEQLKWGKLLTSQEIRERFYQALAAQELQSVYRENLKTIQDHWNQVQLLKKGGSATHYDLLRVEVQKSEAESELLQSEDNFVLARQKLTLSMGLSEDDRALFGSLPEPDLHVLNQFKFEVAQQRADLQAERNSVEAAHSMRRADRSFWFPKVSLGGQYTVYGLLSYNSQSNSVQDPNQYHSAYNLGVFLSWNLFDGLSSVARSQQSFYQEVQAEKQLHQSQIKALYDFEFWRRRFRYSAALFLAKKTEVIKAQESVRLAQVGYQAGVRTNTEILDAELELFKARAGIVHAKLACVEALIHLELTVGQALPVKN